jgi:hypothetical protein
LTDVFSERGEPVLFKVYKAHEQKQCENGGNIGDKQSRRGIVLPEGIQSREARAPAGEEFQRMNLMGYRFFPKSQD